MKRSASLPGPVWLFLIVSFALNLIGVACEVYARYHLRLLFPYSTPVLNEKPAPDLVNYAPQFDHLHTLQFFSTGFPVPYMYPAPVAPFYSFFLALPMRVRVFHGTVVALVLLAAIGFGWYIWRRGLPLWQASLISVGSLLLSYPALFEWKQCNMEIFVCLFVAGGVWFFARKHFYWSAVCLGVAIGMKLFPFVYLGLFLAQKRYKPMFVALGVALVLTLASLAYLGPTIPAAWHGVSADLRFYQQTVPTVMREQIGYDHSLFALVKRSVHMVVDRSNMNPHFDRFLHFYMPVIGIAGLLAYFLRIRKLPFANQVLSLSVASILLPPTSYDYTLLHLYVPWAILVLYAVFANRDRPPGLRMAFLCLAVSTSIQTELIFHQRTLEGQIKALALTALFLIALSYPFAEGPHKDSPNSGTIANA